MVRFISRAVLCPLLFTVGCYDGGPQNSLGDGAEDGAEDGDDDAGDDGAPTPTPPHLDDTGVCIDTTRFFKEQAWTAVMSQKCVGCHNSQGLAAGTDLVLQMPDYPGYLEVNEQTVSNIARLEIQGTPLVLLKPTGEVPHEGGVIFDVDSEEYKVMAEMVDRFAAPKHCKDDAAILKFFKGLVELDEAETLRKAAQILANRAPTPDELGKVASGGIAGLDAVLDDMMEEEAFYQRLMVIFNDHLLTDSYLAGDNAVDTVDMERFPNARWFDGQGDAMRDNTNDMIAREPLEQILWVVRHHLPFSEVITGDYLVVNPFSAQSYGIPAELFDDPTDPTERQIWSFDDIPQAGMLSSSVFLNRYPSTPTNRNRHRSRVVYDFFLGVDVMRLASRPQDIAAETDHNPTVNNPTCNVCHANIDPIAGAFKNWDDNGHYNPPSGWYPEMPAPGFSETDIPSDDGFRSLQWAAEQIVQDPKFSLGIVHLAYESLTGQPPLLEPNQPTDEDYLARVRAFEAQDWVFKKVADKFKASNYELRVVFKELIKSPYFRVINADEDLSEERAHELADMGTARLIPPELLHERLVATTGYAWTKGGENALLSGNYYRFYYGGIDSETVTTRLTEMNGVMASIVRRMANEVSCTVTALDFAKPEESRLLFTKAAITDTPDVLGGEERIRENLTALRGRLIGQVPDEDELDRMYNLWLGVWEDGRAGLADPVAPYPVDLPGQCQATTDPNNGPIPQEMQIVSDPDYTVRAWMAVMNYLLSDFDYLFD
ncbi:MAG: hypothetical protein AAF721_30220 [Myxococcota bacterium]